MKVFVTAFFLFAALTSANSRGAGDMYIFSHEISVGGEGGWDFLSVDEEARRLYVAHATRINVIDLEKNNVIAEISDTPGVHGFAIARTAGRGFSTNGGNHTVSIVDLATHGTLHTVRTEPDPDAVLYEPGRGEVYAFSVGGKSATVIGAVSGRIVATIPLSGIPEFAACDPTAGRIYCNIVDKNEVLVIDAATHAVANRWPVAPGKKPYGMAIDLKNHRLFVGCRNNVMLMMDSIDGRVLDTLPIGNDVDATVFDPETGLAFASCGDGSVTIAKEEIPGKLTVVQTLQTALGAATMALDLKTHNIYLPSARLDRPTETRPGTLPLPPRIVPDTFKILVYKLAKTKSD